MDRQTNTSATREWQVAARVRTRRDERQRGSVCVATTPCTRCPEARSWLRRVVSRHGRDMVNSKLGTSPLGETITSSPRAAAEAMETSNQPSSTIRLHVVCLERVGDSIPRVFTSPPRVRTPRAIWADTLRRFSLRWGAPVSFPLILGFRCFALC